MVLLFFMFFSSIVRSRANRVDHHKKLTNYKTPYVWIFLETYNDLKNFWVWLINSPKGHLQFQNNISVQQF